ncbi:hypothetical protein AAHS21_07410 [Mycobacterium sp. 050272]
MAVQVTVSDVVGDQPFPSINPAGPEEFVQRRTFAVPVLGDNQ